MIFFEEGAFQHVQFCAGELDFVPKIGGVAARGVRLTEGAELRAGLFAEALEFVEGETPLDFDVKELLKIRPVLEHGGSEIAIVGEEDEAAGVVVERADGIDTFWEAAEKIAEGLAAFRIGESGDDFGRLVHEEVDVAALGFNEAASGFDFIFGGIGLGAEFGDDFTVDANLAGEDELLGVATGAWKKVVSNQLSVISYQ
jgi:hypothetical protein